MSNHKDTTIPLEPENFYHIFNRGNKGIRIFHKDENYIYFLKKYDSNLSDYVDTYTYALIPNHFHLLIRVKAEEDILRSILNDYENVPKNLWKIIRERIEEYPENLFQKVPDFLNLIDQSYPKDSVSMVLFLELIPPILCYYVSIWVLSDRFRRFLEHMHRQLINKRKRVVHYSKNLSVEN